MEAKKYEMIREVEYQMMEKQIVYFKEKLLEMISSQIKKDPDFLNEYETEKERFYNDLGKLEAVIKEKLELDGS